MEKKKLTLKEIGIEKVIIMFICAIVLLVLSVPSFLSPDTKESLEPISDTNAAKETTNEPSNNMEYIEWMENRLSDTLMQVAGIGEIKVMITLKSSSEKVALKDAPYSQDSSSETDAQGGSRVSSQATREDETVMVSEESGESVPYIVKEIEPEVEGVLVLAQGADSSVTVSEIVDAVQVLFDVPAHKIKVMKMESGSK